MDRVLIFLGLALLAFMLVIGASLILALPVMWLWNYVIARNVTMLIFGVSKLTFWKAFCFNLLCGLLFKSSTSIKK